MSYAHVDQWPIIDVLNSYTHANPILFFVALAFLVIPACIYNLYMLHRIQSLSSMPKQSIVDYSLDSDDVLLRDLIVEELRAGKVPQATPILVEDDADADADPSCPSPSPPAVDMATQLEEIAWMVSNCNESMTEAGTAHEEFDRLQVLKNYSTLSGLMNDPSLDKLTSMASLILKHDYSWVILMDLRVSHIVSSQGLQNMTICPRNKYFPCAHALRHKEAVMVVPDLTQDPRFVTSPFAVGPLGARFYAAAPLISPEGFRIGVFGVASRRPHPIMSEQDQQILTHLADMSMQSLVALRRKVDLEDKLKKAVACTSHDIMTPLMGLQLTLSTLQEDPVLNVVLSESHRELLSTADSCVSTICRLGTTAMQDVHEGLAAPEGFCPVIGSTSGESGSCLVADLVDRLHQILDPIEKAVPLIITLDPDTPSSIVVDNLKVFRAALALLCLACARTTKGYVMLRIYMEDHNLVFACESTGPSFEECEIASFIDPDHDEADHAVTLPCLRLAAKVIQSLHGTCGYTAPKSLGMSSLLWFSVPDGEVSIDETDPDNELSAVDEEDVTIVSAEAEQPDQAKAERSMTFSVKTHHSPKSPLRNGSWDDLEASLPRPKKVLVIDDSLVVRKTMQRALSTKFGYEVTLAKDGMEGLAKLQETVYDFVLIDFLMPVMDGWDCTQQYRNWEAQHRPWFRQHIIGMSAHANEKDVTRARQFGMDDYRCKPVTIDVLCGLSEDLKICQIQKQLDYLLPLFDKATGQKEDAGLSPLRSPVKRKLGSILCLSSLMIPCDDRQRGASHVKSPKRVKPSLDVVQPVCLVCRSPAADSPWSTLSTTTAFEQHGWKVEVVQTSDEALARLKQRNYDAVIIENDLAPMSSGVGCITQFREWEGKNRVNRQKNALLQFSKNCAISKAVKAGGSIIVQPPAGFDGVLGGETVWEEFESIVGSSVLPCLAKISGIVMR